MNLRQLKYFVSVVEAGNMTRAAEQLHVAQTALGMQIRQIEEDLGIALLLRHSRGVEPTRAGRLLHARALAILKLVDETRREVSACERRSPDDFAKGTLASAHNLPADELSAGKLKKRPLPEDDFNRRVVLFGRDGAQARRMAEALSKRPWHNVAYFRGRFEDLMAGLKGK